MRLEARKYLYDIQRAVALLTEFTAGKACRSRTRISEHRRIIAFRNILITPMPTWTSGSCGT